MNKFCGENSWMSISGDWEKPETEWRDHHHLSVLIMMTDMTACPSQALPSCCGTFSSQNKAPRQSLWAQQKNWHLLLLLPVFLFSVHYFCFGFVFSFLPILVMISKEHYLQHCIACEWAQEKASLPSSLFPELDPLRVSLATSVPHQMSCKKYLCLIVGPKIFHCGVSLAQRVCI